MKRLPTLGRGSGFPTLVALTLWVAAPLVILAVRAHLDHVSFTGAFAPFAPGGQLRYLAWIRDAGGHGLIGDPSALAPDGHIFLHPLFLISGALWRLGIGLQAAYILWLPIALGVLFTGSRAYVARLLPAGRSRSAALVLGLFYVTPLLPLLDWGGLVDASATNRLVIAVSALATFWPAWGYLPTTIAIGLLPLAFLGLERALATKTNSDIARTACAALLVCWLHPWAGLTLLIVVVALAAWDPRARAARVLAPVVVAAAGPLLYYAILASAGPAWSFGRLPAAINGTSAPRDLVLALAPLLIGAVFAVRDNGDALQGRILRLWPVAAGMVYLLLEREGRLPALAGVTLPLAILAVQGWERSRVSHRSGIVVLAVVTLPGLLYCAQTFRDVVRGRGAPYTLQAGEQRALAWLRHAPGEGQILTTPDLASVAAAHTGRRIRESADLSLQSVIATEGSGSAAGAPIFVLSGCLTHAATAGLQAAGYAQRRFGCATVYQRLQ